MPINIKKGFKRIVIVLIVVVAVWLSFSFNEGNLSFTNIVLTAALIILGGLVAIWIVIKITRWIIAGFKTEEKK